MAKYTVAYACRHGSRVEQICGPRRERERRIEWLEANIVCPECFRAKKRAEDAAAPKAANLVVVLRAVPTVAIEVTGELEANKKDLYALGYNWDDSSARGVMSFLSASRPQRVLKKEHAVNSVDGVRAFIGSEARSLHALGYNLKTDIDPLDLAYIRESCAKKRSEAAAKEAAKARLAEIMQADPRPPISPLRERIAQIEAEVGRRWNGKIYGRKGGYSFYVGGENYSASDEEVAEWERLTLAANAWNEKYAKELEAAK